MIDVGWDGVRREEIVPLLRAECDAIENRDPPRTQWHVDDRPTVALLRLLDTRPDEGRARILADIRRPDPRFGGRALVALPDAHLDEVDEHFRKPVEKLLHWSFDLEKLGPLADRYGGPDAVVAAAEKLLDRADAERAEGMRRLDRALRAERRPKGMRPSAILRKVLVACGSTPVARHRRLRAGATRWKVDDLGVSPTVPPASSVVKPLSLSHDDVLEVWSLSPLSTAARSRRGRRPSPGARRRPVDGPSAAPVREPLLWLRPSRGRAALSRYEPAN